MADKRWVSTDGNLSTAASYSPAIVPVVNESVFFDGTSQIDVVAGLTAFSTFDLTTVWIQRPYEGDIGAHGNPFTAQVRKFIHQGAGSVYHAYEPHTAANSNICIDSPNLQDAYTLASESDGSGSFIFLQGAASVSDGVTTIGAINVHPRPGGVGVRLAIGSGTGDVTTYRQSGGFVTTKRDLGTATTPAIIGGGTLVYDSTSSDAWAKLEIVGGRVQYDGTGTLTYGIVQSRGILDMSMDSRAKTITALVLMPGSTFNTHSNITVTALVDLRGVTPILP